jgi:hypothetical protein
MAGYDPANAPAPTVPVGSPGPASLRQYGTAQQTLATNNVPVPGATSGIGTGGGASIQPGQSNGAQGYIEILAGSNPSAGGSVAMVFPSTPPTLFLAASPDSFGTISQATVSNTVTVSWTGTLSPSKRHRIAYQWATSK